MTSHERHATHAHRTSGCRGNLLQLGTNAPSLTKRIFRLKLESCTEAARARAHPYTRTPSCTLVSLTNTADFPQQNKSFNARSAQENSTKTYLCDTTNEKGFPAHWSKHGHFHLCTGQNEGQRLVVNNDKPLHKNVHDN